MNTFEECGGKANHAQATGIMFGMLSPVDGVSIRMHTPLQNYPTSVSEIWDQDDIQWGQGNPATSPPGGQGIPQVDSDQFVQMQFRDPFCSAITLVQQQDLMSTGNNFPWLYLWVLGTDISGNNLPYFACDNGQETAVYPVWGEAAEGNNYSTPHKKRLFHKFDNSFSYMYCDGKTNCGNLIQVYFAGQFATDQTIGDTTTPLAAGCVVRLWEWINGIRVPARISSSTLGPPANKNTVTTGGPIAVSNINSFPVSSPPIAPFVAQFQIDHNGYYGISIQPPAGQTSVPLTTAGTNAAQCAFWITTGSAQGAAPGIIMDSWGHEYMPELDTQWDSIERYRLTGVGFKFTNVSNAQYKSGDSVALQVPSSENWLNYTQNMDVYTAVRDRSTVTKSITADVGLNIGIKPTQLSSDFDWIKDTVRINAGGWLEWAGSPLRQRSDWMIACTKVINPLGRDFKRRRMWLLEFNAKSKYFQVAPPDVNANTWALGVCMTEEQPNINPNAFHISKILKYTGKYGNIISQALKGASHPAARAAGEVGETISNIAGQLYKAVHKKRKTKGG
jgi:hypothetical protein